MSIQSTSHSEKRARQRVGFSRKALKRMLDRVWEKGLKIAELSEEERLLVQRKVRPEQAEYVRVYAGYIYIIESSRLITVFPMEEPTKEWDR